MSRLLATAFFLLCALLSAKREAHASRSDGMFPLTGGVPLPRSAVVFHQSTSGELRADLLSYDAAGRLAQDAYWIYTWDAAGRLTGMTRKAGTFTSSTTTGETVAFGYDADGRRTTKTRTTVETGGITRTTTSKVLWAGWLPVFELRSRSVTTGTATTTTNLLPRFFQWGPDLSGTLPQALSRVEGHGAGGIGGLVAILEVGAAGSGARKLLPIHDGLGNVTAVVDAATGATVARYEYGPFGEPLGESGDVDACPFRWQTKWYDAESQHYYFGYRHYDPRLGRWLSRDPLGEAGGFNLYAYCGNDPVNRHDPLGLKVVVSIRDPETMELIWESEPQTTKEEILDLTGATQTLMIEAVTGGLAPRNFYSMVTAADWHRARCRRVGVEPLSETMIRQVIDYVKEHYGPLPTRTSNELLAADSNLLESQKALSSTE